MKPTLILYTDGNQDEFIEYIADELRCHSFNGTIEIEKAKPSSHPLELISAEIQHQQLKYNSAHDDEHTDSELIQAAVNYLYFGSSAYIEGLDVIPWPFDEAPEFSDSKTHNLVCAAALIAAEIARLQRMQTEKVVAVDKTSGMTASGFFKKVKPFSKE